MSESKPGLLLIKATPQSMKAAEQFLKNREWPFATTANVKEAIKLMMQHRPPYVMIPVDHKNKMVRKLPPVFLQLFGTVCIAYLENSGSNSMALIQEWKLPHNLYPPVSGPAIIRMLAKLEKDKEIRARNPSLETQTPETADPTSEKFDGSALGGGKTILLNGHEQAQGGGMFLGKDGKPSNEPLIFAGEGQDANQLLSQLLGAAEETEDSGPGSFLAKGADKKSGGGYRPGPATDTDSGGGYRPGEMIPAEDPNSMQQEGGDHFGGDFVGVGGKDKKKENPSITQESSLGEIPNIMPSEPDVDGTGFGHAPGSTKKAKKAGYNPEQSAKEGESGGYFPEQKEKKPSKAQKPKAQGTEVALNPAVQPFLDSAREALNEALANAKENTPLGKVKSLGTSSQIACMAISSKNFSGYLVLAMGSDRKMDEELFEVVAENFKKFLKGRGEVFDDEKGVMDLQVRPVKFMPWARSQAEFLLDSVHDENEIAMAFFPAQNVDVSFADSAKEHMTKMSIDELRQDVPLEFDVYLHMPANDKYVLYGKRGRSLVDNQKDRLQNKGVDEIHLRKEAVPEVRKYKAQNFLNDKIKEFSNQNSDTQD